MPTEKMEERLRRVIADSPNIFLIVTGPEMRIEFANEALFASWNRDESIIGKPLLVALPEIQDQHFPKVLSQVYSSGETYYGKKEKAVLIKNGEPTEAYYNYVYQPVMGIDGTVCGITIMATDITEEVRNGQIADTAREEAEKLRRLYETITASTPDLIYVFDLNYRFIYANQALLNMWGSTWEHSIGKGLRENGYEEWHAVMHEREIDQVVDTRKPIRGEVSFPHATLGSRVYDYIFVPVLDAKGNVEAVAGTTRDITELKNTEQALKKSEERLEQQVKDRTRELKRSNDALQRFAHVASHDLKEPVRKVRLFTERIKEDLIANNVTDAINHVDRIEKAAARMQSMIESILAYSTFSVLEPESENVDLNDVLSHVITDLELLIADKRASVQLQSLPSIQGHTVLLYQLFYNLVNNALKFSKSDTPPVIKIIPAIVENTTPYYEICVEDNGIGFNNADASLIFDNFTRLHSKDKYEGTGLGLSLCKTIMERHRGSITAEGIEGAGATFRIQFPLVCD